MIDFIAANTWVFLTLVILFSLTIGSFLNVVIYRLPIILERDWQKECMEFLGKEPEFSNDIKKYNLAHPASHCPFCNQLLTIWQNIPVISYLILGGKCAHCQNKIPLRYLIVELLSCLLAVIAAIEFGFSLSLLFVLIFTWVLVAITFIDIDHQILPDILSLSLIWLGLLASCFNLFTNSHDAILGAIFGYGSFWIIGKLFELVRHKEGIGQGDFKLLAAIGAWVGWQILPFVILTSSFLALIIGGGFLLISHKSHRTPIPFGPFIAIAGFIAIIWGFDISQYYLHAMGLPIMLDVSI
ncbi:MAG: A24 family peptidase [Pseudomonadota bacterium]